VVAIERFEYLMVLAACVLVTLPLEFAFGARVWRRPRRLARTLAPILVVYLAWDVWKTQRGVWFFDDDAVVGIDLPRGVADRGAAVLRDHPRLHPAHPRGGAQHARRHHPVAATAAGEGRAMTLAVAVYPATAIASAVIVVTLELLVFRTGVLRQSSFWTAMLIVYAFMIPVDGWLTAMPDPIVGYRPADVSGWRPIWDILAEEYVYAFGLLLLTVVLWERAGERERDRSAAVDRQVDRRTGVDA
jgi:lycopene cyclase domain-containing protein